MCRKTLPGDKAWVKPWLEKKKKIYLVACWARWGVLECIYAGGAGGLCGTDGAALRGAVSKCKREAATRLL